jgi:cell division septation protein DedD
VTDLSNDSTDDGFHEIQLSGKQLVFLFMATTVVSVVIFLCGVLVGRGVRGEGLAASTNRPAVSAAGATPSVPDTTPTSPPAAAETAAPASRPLTYTERLQAEKAAQENLKAPTAVSEPATEPPASTSPASTPPVPQQPAVASSAPVSKPLAPKGTSSTPAPVSASIPDTGSASPAPGVWAVQVVALTDHAAASAVAERLKSKGYTAFLVAPKAGAPVKNYKVQIGRFGDRAEAQQIADRLKREEQFEPWILR